MISGFQVITGDGAASELFEDQTDAICWANETNLAYEVIDVEKGRVVWTDHDQYLSEEPDGQPDELTEWMDFDPDC